MVTGPKSENRSIRKSRSMAGSGFCSVIPAQRLRRCRWRCEPPSASLEGWSRAQPLWPSFEARKKARAPQDDVAWRKKLAVDLGGGQLHRLAAAAGRDLVRVVEDELGLHLVGLVVHLGAQQEQHRLGIDQDLDALVLDHFVGGADIVGIFDGVGLPGAAAVLDPNPKADDLGIGAFCQLDDPR